MGQAGLLDKKVLSGDSQTVDAKRPDFLVKRTDKGNSFVGYGVIKEFIERNRLSKAEREECEKRGWRGALVFSELYRFNPPLPIKETILGGLGQNHITLHS